MSRLRCFFFYGHVYEFVTSLQYPGGIPAEGDPSKTWARCSRCNHWSLQERAL